MRSGAAPPVYTGPGAMAFTRTPLGLNSAAQARVIDARAAFVAPYAAPPARPIWPAMLLTLMMLPLPLAAIPGANAATRKNAARTLLANRASNVATSRSGVAPNQENPALLTNTSISPTASTRRWRSAGSLRSAPMNAPGRPERESILRSRRLGGHRGHGRSPRRRRGPAARLLHGRSLTSRPSRGPSDLGGYAVGSPALLLSKYCGSQTPRRSQQRGQCDGSRPRELTEGYPI